MKCLWYYEWVKLPRKLIPEGKGVMGDFIRLAGRAAFRKGISSYCGYNNVVEPGMWAGGIVGIKSILGVKSRNRALEALERLNSLNYIKYELNEANKKLEYRIKDWVIKCSGEPCMKGAVYTTNGYGFLCIPRDITERLVNNNYIFDEADAWLDLWCHTAVNDPNNAFSYMAPAIQYGKYGAVLTLETLGQRWGWEKTKVWRFMKKHGDAFALYRLSSSYGCLIFNKLYPCDKEISLPAQEEINDVISTIKQYSAYITKTGSEHEHLSNMVAWYSRKITCSHYACEDIDKGKDRYDRDNEKDIAHNCMPGCHRCIKKNEDCDASGNYRVADSCPIIYAYFSLCRNSLNNNDCSKVNYISADEKKDIRGPCIRFVDLDNAWFPYAAEE